MDSKEDQDAKRGAALQIMKALGEVAGVDILNDREKHNEAYRRIMPILRESQRLVAGFTLEDCEEARERIEVDGGKYAFIDPKDDWRIFVLRYGQPWLHIEAGSNAIRELMAEVAEGRKR